MTTTFLVTLSTSDTDFSTQALEIQDILEKAGLDIITVHPWARPSLAPPSPLPPFPPQNPLAPR